MKDDLHIMHIISIITIIDSLINHTSKDRQSGTHTKYFTTHLLTQR